MYARHELVWLTAQGWDAAQAFAHARENAKAGAGDTDTASGGAVKAEVMAALERWRLAGWPLVARRRDADASADEACLGLALPPDPVSEIKLRIGLRVPAGGVATTAPPLALKDAVGRLTASASASVSLSAPAASLPPVLAAWLPALAALRDEATGLDVRVYGSLALQALTGLPYLRPASDIDLLLQPASDRQLCAGLALFTRHAVRLPLDGEIVFPRGEAVSWKEWAAAQASGARVLAKERDTVRLIPPALLAATLKAA